MFSMLCECKHRVKTAWPNGVQRSGSFEACLRKMATFVAILCVLFGIVFPLGSACTGEYYFVTINSGIFFLILLFVLE